MDCRFRRSSRLPPANFVMVSHATVWWQGGLMRASMQLLRLPLLNCLIGSKPGLSVKL